MNLKPNCISNYVNQLQIKLKVVNLINPYTPLILSLSNISLSVIPIGYQYNTIMDFNGGGKSG